MSKKLNEHFNIKPANDLQEIHEIAKVLLHQGRLTKRDTKYGARFSYSDTDWRGLADKILDGKFTKDEKDNFGWNFMWQMIHTLNAGYYLLSDKKELCCD